jgi:hypothetical protein
MSPNIGLRIPTETLKRLQALAGANGCSVSDVVRLAIDKYLDLPQPLAGDSLETRITALEQALAVLADSQTSVSRPLAPVSSRHRPKAKAVTKIQSGKALAPVSTLLTTPEAATELERRGCQISNATLKRRLPSSTLEIPSELAAFGLRCDPEMAIARAENPKGVHRWLFFV